MISESVEITRFAYCCAESVDADKRKGNLTVLAA
jgi:hypothetical protein